jgi:hypothetical protein
MLVYQRVNQSFNKTYEFLFPSHSLKMLKVLEIPSCERIGVSMSYKVALNQQDDYNQLLIEKHQKNNATPSTEFLWGKKKWQKPYYTILETSC